MTDDFIPPDLVARHATALPRYTSYPTANHFHDGVGRARYREWLAALPPEAPVSAYVHVPFCQELCWYCGCSTKATRRYAPVSDYVATLEAEIASLRAALPARPRLAHLHWGGGSPDILAADDVARLRGALERCFSFGPETEFAVEIDPRLMSEQKADSFVRAGATRISIGVQDFEPEVQQAIGRLQSFETTRETVRLFRERGVGSINMDLVYGLPRQTQASLARTLELAIGLAPDRIAIFGYAHLPQRLTHQRLIDESTLPDAQQRFAQARLAAKILGEAGYVRRGVDHFAKPGDALALAPLKRNFQGYTTDGCETLIGVGASAIGRLPQGYVQNAAAANRYTALIEAEGLAAARGFALSPEDVMRALVIERLMCDFAFPGAELGRRFGARAQPLIDEAALMLVEDRDGLLRPAEGGFRLSERGRPFVRHLAARFDAYLGTGAPAKHSLAI